MMGIEVITPAVSYENFIHFIPNIANRLSDAGFYGDEMRLSYRFIF